MASPNNDTEEEYGDLNIKSRFDKLCAVEDYCWGAHTRPHQRLRPAWVPEAKSESEEEGYLDFGFFFLCLPSMLKTPEEREEEEKKRKQVEELVREYDGSCLSAVPKSCLETIMLWTGFSAFVSTSFPITMRGGEKPNWPPVEVVRVVLMFLAVAFYGSVLGLLMLRKSPKLSFYSGYVSLISLLFALGMIAFFTVMWVFERN